MERRKDVMAAERRRHPKGDIILRVLERVEEGMGDAAAMFEAFLAAGYGASYGKLEREFARARARTETATAAAQLEKEARRRYQKLLYLLRKDELVEEQKKARGRFFLLTKRGVAKLAALRKRKQRLLPKVEYKREKSDVFSVVIFDVPETEKRKREWLRASLRQLGFTLVQKSVWLGNVKVPKEFLDDLRALELIGFVEIFQITKTGSLERLSRRE